jgi:hypothetical protein
MDVGVFVPVKIRDAIDDGIWFLRSGSVVEPNQRTAVHPLFKNGKVAADQLGIQRTFCDSQVFGHDVGPKFVRSMGSRRSGFGSGLRSFVRCCGLGACDIA